jgi:thiol-disulfide isomerase/thioredoxin
MKNDIFILLLFFTVTLYTQRTISGTFSPPEDYTWLIAYHLKPGTQVYVADTAIIDGKFELTIPENSPLGIYRLAYAVPQEEFNFDIIYTGKEDINFNFDTSSGITFTKSNENILFRTYFNEIQEAERQLISFYTNGSSDMEEFKKITQNYSAVQNSFLEKSSDLMAQGFIKANAPYIPRKYESIVEYVRNRKEKYFDALDVTKPVLQASRFLTDKLSNYVFTALPLEQMTAEATEKAMQENLTTLVEKLDGISNAYEFSLLYTIWTQATESDLKLLADTVYNDYLKPKVTTDEHKTILSEIALQTRLRLGAVAPEIEWKDGTDLESLSKLSDSENYVLVFWSSTCGHCLRELPALHKRIKENKNVKVLAIGLEDDDANWKLESAKLEAFEHAIALGKWESDYAHLYGIESTPTYFILDKDKRIIAKPEIDKEVIAFLEKK